MIQDTLFCCESQCVSMAAAATTDSWLARTRYEVSPQRRRPRPSLTWETVWPTAAERQPQPQQQQQSRVYRVVTAERK